MLNLLYETAGDACGEATEWQRDRMGPWFIEEVRRVTMTYDKQIFLPLCYTIALGLQFTHALLQDVCDL